MENNDPHDTHTLMISMFAITHGGGASVRARVGAAPAVGSRPRACPPGHAHGREGAGSSDRAGPGRAHDDSVMGHACNTRHNDIVMMIVVTPCGEVTIAFKTVTKRDQ